MRDRTVWRPALMVAATLVMALLGCTAIENSHARNKEQLLAAAGFHERPADTPDKIKQLESLPDHKLLRREQNGKLYYVYADATACKCLYVGDETNYDDFQKLAVQQQIAEEETMAAQINQEYAMDWGAWGPWW
jgi:hypothetical protein